MLKNLVEKYGKRKVNTLTKYPSILTLHQLGERGTLTDEFTTTELFNEKLFATEKIDGTNVRIIISNDSIFVGSREDIIYSYGDLYYGMDLNIVDSLTDLGIINKCIDFQRNDLDALITVIFGELYGGNTGSAKQYGKDKYGFRVFDMAIYNDLSILELAIDKISLWREKIRDHGMEYGQKFIPINRMQEILPDFELVPYLEDFELTGTSHIEVYEALKKFLPQTNVSHSDNALKKAEGIVLRNAFRTKIVKLRFEDYERTLRNK